MFFDKMSPSFEMNIQSFIPNESIGLIGRNNWNNLVITHSLLIIVSIVLIYFAINSRWFENYILFRFLTISLFIAIGEFVYRTFKNARHSTYLKEEIKFNKEGILLNAKAGGKHTKLVKREGLKHFNLIYDGQRFKFLLYGLDKPYFEFAILENEQLSPNAFLDNFINIFDLEIQESATFTLRTILTLKQKQHQKGKSKKLKLTKNTRQLAADKSPSVKSKSVKKYKPKGFYYYQLKAGLIIEQNLGKEVMAIPNKIGVSRLQKMIWYRNFFFFKKEIKFSEIKKYDFGVERRIVKSRKYIEGILVIITVDDKKKKIFTIERELEKQQELVELEVLKDLRFLRQLIKKEILAKTT